MQDLQDAHDHSAHHHHRFAWLLSNHPDKAKDLVDSQRGYLRSERGYISQQPLCPAMQGKWLQVGEIAA
jgi:hypothetical protein